MYSPPQLNNYFHYAEEPAKSDFSRELTVALLAYGMKVPAWILYSVLA